MLPEGSLLGALKRRARRLKLLCFDGYPKIGKDIRSLAGRQTPVLAVSLAVFVLFSATWLLSRAEATAPTPGDRVAPLTWQEDQPSAEAAVASVPSSEVAKGDLAAGAQQAVTPLVGPLPNEAATPAPAESGPQATPTAEPQAQAAVPPAPQPSNEPTQRPSAPARTLTSRDGQQPRVGLQAGHWRRAEAPAPFKTNTGASGGGKTEAEVNLDIAQRTAALLRDVGCVVDVLPTWFNPGYKADVFVAIHADGGPADRRGFFADPPANSRNKPAEQRLVDLLNEEHAKATGIPYQNRSTVNSRYYYGFSRVDANTPRALIELGFLTNAADRAVLLGSPDEVARGLANAIVRFLQERR